MPKVSQKNQNIDGENDVPEPNSISAEVVFLAPAASFAVQGQQQLQCRPEPGRLRELMVSVLGLGYEQVAELIRGENSQNGGSICKL